jgi:hypothetical protein
MLDAWGIGVLSQSLARVSNTRFFLFFYHLYHYTHAAWRVWRYTLHSNDPRPILRQKTQQKQHTKRQQDKSERASPRPQAHKPAASS